ncbi:MAG TPA: glycosyltransferase family 2 protein [Patescibacteria group bacterium]|nr:glycosyltransferase family 2 protein [Patescibacteria group bacterium]
MDISIIIVSWNVKDKLRENIKSIYQSIGDFSFEIIVADNDSSDDSANMVKHTFPDVSLIRNKDNLGFAKACNQGITRAQGKYILLLNPDMKLERGTLNNFIIWLKNNPQADIASCKLVDEKGNIVRHVRRFPRFCDQLAIVLKLPHLLSRVLNKYLRKDFDYNQSSKVDSVRGAFFAIKKDSFKNNLLDERYFLWFEEVDFCKYASSIGKEVWYTNKASAIDLVGKSFSQLKTYQTQKYFSDSMLKYFKKWHPYWQYFILFLSWQLVLFFTWLFKGNLNKKRKQRT